MSADTERRRCRRITSPIRVQPACRNFRRAARTEFEHGDVPATEAQGESCRSSSDNQERAGLGKRGQHRQPTQDTSRSTPEIEVPDFARARVCIFLLAVQKTSPATNEAVNGRAIVGVSTRNPQNSTMNRETGPIAPPTVFRQRQPSSPRRPISSVMTWPRGRTRRQHAGKRQAEKAGGHTTGRADRVSSASPPLPARPAIDR